MKKDEWRQVEAWVYRALELSEDERQIMLEGLSARQQILGKEVMALVEAHQHISKFLEPPINFAFLKAHSDGNSKAILSQEQWRSLVMGYGPEKDS